MKAQKKKKNSTILFNSIIIRGIINVEQFNILEFIFITTYINMIV